jgi:haloalkane dehalogenase
MQIEQRRAGDIAYREALPTEPSERLPVLCIHGYPESSMMWRDLLGPLAASGRRAIALDLPGYGSSAPTRTGSWEDHMEAVEEFRRKLGLERIVLVVHDWGGMIGIRWACHHPDAVGAMVLSNTGFFPNGRWHGLAKTLRTKGEGEATLDAIDREGLGAMLRASGSGFDDERLDDYWRAFETKEGRRRQLELYRSGDFEKIEAYDGQLAALNVPTLLLWGEKDVFAPVAGAYRFQRELPDTALALVEDAGHFVFEDDPERCATEIVAFLDAAGV